jgi:hypothetical protein
MKEIRLTFRADDFGAVSQTLIGMGIGFRVEPVEDAPAEAVAPRAAPAQPILKRRAAKKGTKASVKKPPPPGETLLTGADRLRSALVRKAPDLAPASPPADAAEMARSSPSGEDGT